MSHDHFLGSPFYSVLGPALPIGRRTNPPRGAIKGGEESQEWRAIILGQDGDGAIIHKLNDQGEILGLISCGVCGRPLPGYPEEGVPSITSDEWAAVAAKKRGVSPRQFGKYIGWAWKLGHPEAKRSAGRPREYHTECRLMLDGWDRFMRAQEQVEFSPDAVGDLKIKGWQKRIQELRNGFFGSGRFSEAGRRAMFSRKKPRR